MSLNQEDDQSDLPQKLFILDFNQEFSLCVAPDIANVYLQVFLSDSFQENNDKYRSRHRHSLTADEIKEIVDSSESVLITEVTLDFYHLAHEQKDSGVKNRFFILYDEEQCTFKIKIE